MSTVQYTLADEPLPPYKPNRLAPLAEEHNLTEGECFVDRFGKTVGLIDVDVEADEATTVVEGDGREYPEALSDLLARARDGQLEHAPAMDIESEINPTRPSRRWVAP